MRPDDWPQKYTTFLAVNAPDHGFSPDKEPDNRPVSTITYPDNKQISFLHPINTQQLLSPPSEWSAPQIPERKTTMCTRHKIDASPRNFELQSKDRC